MPHARPARWILKTVNFACRHSAVRATWLPRHTDMSIHCARLIAVLALLASTGIFSSAYAGQYVEDLKKCLARATTPDDRVTLVRWVYSTMALHPSLRSVAAVPDDLRERLEKNAVTVFERLVTEDCRKESAQALTFENVDGLRAGYAFLGQTAMLDLATHPLVAAAVSALARQFDHEKMWKAFEPEETVNCAVNGVRKWTVRSKCD